MLVEESASHATELLAAAEKINAFVRETLDNPHMMNKLDHELNFSFVHEISALVLATIIVVISLFMGYDETIDMDPVNCIIRGVSYIGRVKVRQLCCVNSSAY